MANETLTSSASVGTLARLEALWRRLGGDAGVEDLLSGRSRIIYNTPRPRATGDVVINVSRQEIPDAYNPDPSFKEWAFPELMGNGPTIYGLSQIDLWMHPDQAPMEGTVTGHQILEQLKFENALSDCATLQDAFLICDAGLATYHKYFKGKNLFFWGSPYIRKNGMWAVLSLGEVEGCLVLGYRPLDANWKNGGPAARFLLPADE